MAKARFGLVWPNIDAKLLNINDLLLQSLVARRMPECDAFFALSGAGLTGGRILQKRGGVWLCERTSAHIRVQFDLLDEEHRRWGVPSVVRNQYSIQKEIDEYKESDMVVVPSAFVKRSFVEQGFSEARIRVVPLGVSTSRFAKVGEPDSNEFRVLFVGQVGLRKGFPYLLEAFHRLNHPNKKLIVIGTMNAGMKPVLAKLPSDRVEYLGAVPHAELKRHYSRAHAFVLPSIEDGFGSVMAEALACGCPVIASEHTGARDCFTDGVEGFVVPACDEDAILDRLERLAQDPELQKRMRANAVSRVKSIGGWDTYTTNITGLITDLVQRKRAGKSSS
jgi:glycosyltransferase involved in cell wall biosynthesis